MICSENISIGADDDARAEALKCLLSLPLRKLPSEKLSQRVIGKRKRGLRSRHGLGGKHSHHARRHLLDDRCEAGDNTLLHRCSFLRRSRKCARRDAQDRADQQPEGSENSCLHKTFPLQEIARSTADGPFLLMRFPTKVERVVLNALVKRVRLGRLGNSLTTGSSRTRILKREGVIQALP